MASHRPVIALEARLKGCKNVITLGVRSNLFDYRKDEIELLKRAEKIYYPTAFYADLFDTMGKQTFPSYHTYKCVQDKIKQTALFNLLDIPHPRTRVFYGRRQKTKITDYFSFPFVGKIPRGSARGTGVYLIRDREDLDAYCEESSPAYIQEYLEIDRDIRVVVIGRRIVHAYWRISMHGEFRSNVSMGATISLEPVPEKALALALHTATSCRWDDVGIDICQYEDRFYVLEANMKYGKEGFRVAGIDYKALMEELIENEEI
ncbi:MAG: RimK family alpha-L-glutamate ligase [Deltaproteobacteria bacterium]|nr:RimK family alpha-L-glutamate ligase [Deltaproteobacteria bacterium]MBW2151391.1 RimK family alpha-L-glutamate ligase [Deltaproteobacteria bacterium]